MTKHLYMTLDTETCGGFACPLVYDIGYTIHDRFGHIYEQGSYIIREIFYGEWKKMRTAYYADKIPSYKEGIRNGDFTVISFWAIRKQMLEAIAKYHIKAVIAYNAGFDVNALNCTMNHLSKFDREQTFFNEKTVIWDSWHMSCQTILRQKTFFKKAIKNEWTSECGNVKTSAEVAYRYLTDEIDFIESHTALQDALIETAIFAKCISTHKKMNRTIVRMPWKIPQSEFKAYCIKYA